MVRTVMYIFILFVVFWNINATSHVFSLQPDFEDEVITNQKSTRNVDH